MYRAQKTTSSSLIYRLLFVVLFVKKILPGEYYLKNRSSCRIWLNRNDAIMYFHNFTNKSKSEPYASQFTAPGFIHAEEWIKHPLSQLRWDSTFLEILSISDTRTCVLSAAETTPLTPSSIA